MTTARWEDGERRRYDQWAIALHWLIAAAILVQVLLGWWMNEWVPDHSPQQAAIRPIHISLGITILFLVLVRIGVRLAHKPPPFPASTPPLERFLAKATHLLFYVLLLILPLSGWAMVSLGTKPIPFWGLTWPHMPFVHDVFGNPPSKATRESISHFHVFVLIWIVVINLALHVAGALWHQVRGRPILYRMLPSWLAR